MRWRLNDFTGARASLKGFQVRPEQEDPRGWEWNYLEGLYASDLLTLQHPEGGSAGGVAVSPDGKYIASVFSGSRQKVHIWSANDGQLLYTLPAGANAHRLVFRHDGQQLAVAGGASVSVWDLASRRLTEHHIHVGVIVGLAYSPDGEWLASASWDGTVKVWNATTGKSRFKNLASLPHSDRAHSVAFSPDGRWLATGDQDGKVYIWDAKTGAKAQLLEGHKSPVYGVAFDPEGKRLASAGSNGNMRLWDLNPWLNSLKKRENGKTFSNPPLKPRVVQSLTGNVGSALSMDFSPDGRYLACGGSDATARVWHLESGVLRVIFRGHTAAVEGVRFDPDGRRLISCSPEQGAVKVWDLTRHPEYSTLARTRHPEYPSPTQTGTWPEVKVWDMLRESAGPRPARTGPDVEALAFQDGGKRLVSVTVGGRLQTWDTTAGLLLEERVLPLNVDLISPARLADFARGGERLAARRSKPGDEGKVVGCWDVATGKPLTTFEGHRYPVFSVRFSGDGLHLATMACDRQEKSRPHEVKVWDACKGGKALATHQGQGILFGLALSPDGKWLATGDENGGVKVVDWARGKVMLDEHGHRGPVTVLSFSRDGRYLASAGVSDQTVKVWKCDKWTLQATAEAPGLLCDLCFDPDDQRLAGISRDVVKLWDLQTGQELLSLRGAPQRHRDPAFNARISFSADGRRLAGSNWDESISVWESEAPSEERQAARRQAAQRRAPLWHLEEAEHCVLVKNQIGANFHLKHIGDSPLPAPLEERKKHLIDQKKREIWP